MEPRPTTISTLEVAFVGRSRELTRLQELWLAGARVVTALGPGGAGKSRLAKEALTQSRGAGWTEWVSLTGATRAAEIVGAVAQTFGVWPRGEDREERLDVGAALAERGPGTLCLDEAEGCVEPLRALLTSWITEAPELRVLVTSRQRLGTRDEAIVEVGALEPEEALLLYRLRAALKVPGWELAAAEAEALARLLDRVSRLPLGIELAAAQVGTRTVEELSSALDRGDEALVDPAGSANPRHRSLDRCVASSFHALEPGLEAAILALSVLRGPFDSALAAVALDLGDPSRVQAKLTALYDRSLLNVLRDPGRIRFAVYEPVREVALARLEAGGERDRVELRVARSLAEFGAQAAVELHEGEGRRVAASLQDRKEDLRWAFFAAVPRWPELAVGLALGLDGALLAAGPVGLHQEVLSRALTLAQEAGLRGAEVDLLRVNARAAFLRGRQREGEGYIQAARALAAATLDDRRLREVQLVESAIARECGRPDRAEVIAQASLQSCLAAGDLRGAVRARHNRAAARSELGRTAEAYVDFAEALLEAQAHGCHRIEALCLVNLGILARKEGELSVASARTAQGAAAFTALGEILMAGKCLSFAARIAEERGELEEADRLALAAAEHQRRTGDVSIDLEQRFRQGLRALHQGDKSLARLCFDDVWAGARHFGNQEMIDEAERQLRRLERAPSGAAGGWSVGGGAYWFEASAGSRIELGRRPSLRRILAHLVDLRLTEPGRAATVVELVAVGWPGENPRAESGAERVYTAIRTLRAFGLKELLIQRDGGYVLEPSVPLHRRD